MNNEQEELLTDLLNEISQKLMKVSIDFIKEKVIPNHQFLVDRFTHVLPLIYFHSMNVVIAHWLEDEKDIETYKNRMETDLKRYLAEFREQF